MPEMVIGVEEEPIRNTDIPLDELIVRKLREI
jgi:hypothetical protein